MSRAIVCTCVFGIIYAITVYHYVAANKVLLNKKYCSSYKLCWKTTHNSDNLFSFKTYFIRIAKLYICPVLVRIM